MFAVTGHKTQGKTYHDGLIIGTFKGRIHSSWAYVVLSRVPKFELLWLFEELDKTTAKKFKLDDKLVKEVNRLKSLSNSTMNLFRDLIYPEGFEMDLDSVIKSEQDIRAIPNPPIQLASQSTSPIAIPDDIIPVAIPDDIVPIGDYKDKVEIILGPKPLPTIERMFEEWKSNQNRQGVLFSKYGVDLIYEDITRLYPNVKLSDNLVDLFLGFLKERRSAIQNMFVFSCNL